MAASKGSGDQELVELQKALLSGPTADVPFADPDPEAHQSWADRRAAQRETYGQFRATGDIFDPRGVVLAFTKGHPVPVEHVEKWDLERTGHVERVASVEDARAGRTPQTPQTSDSGPSGSSPAAASPKTTTDK